MMAVKPSILYEQLADIVTQVVKKPFREEYCTPEELDNIAEQIARHLWNLNPRSIKP